MIPFICGYMKALLFTDLHGSEKTLKKIFDFISNPANQIKMMLFAGDFVNMGEPLEYQKKFIQLHTLNSVPLFWVPGNNDFGRGASKIQSNRKSKMIKSQIRMSF